VQADAKRAGEAYRRVELDARIEGSTGPELVRICLEEAIAALRFVELAATGVAHRDCRGQLKRAHSVLLWLVRSVAGDNPVAPALRQFYGGAAAVVRKSMVRPDPAALSRTREDLADVLAASRSN
jgi:hypothetical protein